MTEIFNFADLTWSQVAALPRDCPLVIPLGSGYPMEKLAEALGNPPRLGMLPPVPYGWRGSGIALPEAILGAYMRNLLDSLRDDGFSRAFALTPQGIDLGLGAERLALPGAAHPAVRLPPDDQRGKVILVPVGHTEQHGYHLPLSVDTLCIDAITRGTAAAAAELAYNLPVMPYGVSTHRASFAGTLNAGGRAFEDFYLSLLDVLVGRGFDRFYLLSGHGGNCSFLTNVVKYAGERHPHAFIATTWLYLNGPKGTAALEQYRQSPPGGLGHACELETSLMLHLRPELVHLELAVDETDFITTPSYFMDWVEGGALVANPPWTDDTRTGAYGAGSLGTPEKGRLWLQAAIDEKVDHVKEIHEQIAQRQERRHQNGIR